MKRDRDGGHGTTIPIPMTFESGLTYEGNNNKSLDKEKKITARFQFHPGIRPWRT